MASTPSCTATRTSRSSTGRATPRSWSTRRPASGSRRWRSPTTTASTGSSASRSAAQAVGLPTVFGAELTLGLEKLDREPAASRMVQRHGCPTRASTSSCSPTGRSATPGSPARSAPGSSRGRRVRPASRSSGLADGGASGRCTSTATATPRATTRWFVLTGCRKGTVPRALLADGPAAARRALDRLIDAFGRDRVLVELWDHGDPLDRHRNDALAAGRDAGRRRRGRHQQRALRHARVTARSPPRSRRSGRVGRSTRSTAGCPRRRSRTCGRRRSRRAGSRAGPGAVERTVEIARGVRVRPAARRARPARPRGARRPHRHVVAARAHAPRRRGAVPVDAPAARAGEAPDRVRARRHRAARLPRLLPAARRHRRVLPRATTSTARAAGAPRTARSATRSASPRPTRSRSACCSSGSSRPSATARPTSTSTSSTSAARR